MKQLWRRILGEESSRELPSVKNRDIEIERYIPEKINKVVPIVGFRRAGKTYLSFLFMKYLLNKGVRRDSAIYINFEDERIPEKTEALTTLSDVMTELFVEERKYYLFLDEIQNIPLWSKWVRRMLDTNKYALFLTGSSSKLSSKEIPTELRGRALSIELFPLSFKEYLNFMGIEPEGFLSEPKMLSMLREYVVFGGFPEIVLAEKGRKYLLIDDYFETFLIRDVFERYNIRQKAAMKEMIKLLLNSTYFTISKLHNTMKRSGYKIGKATCANYLYYLECSYFLYPLLVFSPKVKDQMQHPKKVYFVDNFFISKFSLRFSENFGRLMENSVAVELFRRNAKNPLLEVYYWKDYQQKEVDFVVKEGLRVRELIQVTYASGRDEIPEREVSSLIKAGKELDCSNLLVITWDYDGEDTVKGKKITYKPLWKWLLNHV